MWRWSNDNHVISVTSLIRQKSSHISVIAAHRENRDFRTGWRKTSWGDPFLPTRRCLSWCWCDVRWRERRDESREDDLDGKPRFRRCVARSRWSKSDSETSPVKRFCSSFSSKIVISSFSKLWVQFFIQNWTFLPLFLFRCTVEQQSKLGFYDRIWTDNLWVLKQPLCYLCQIVFPLSCDPNLFY